MNAAAKENTATDVLLLDKIYKDPVSAFRFAPKRLEEIKDTALIFLDTNVLLVPYNTGKGSLSQIGEVYERLVSQERLFIPSRVMQEFEKNVPDQLTNLVHQIDQKRNLSITSLDIPLIQTNSSFVAVKTIERELTKQLALYRKELARLIDEITSWHHDDPIRSLYRRVFSIAQLVDYDKTDPTKILENWKWRKANAVPPGYKDGSKQDTGIGDFLIWLSILDKARVSDKDAIFVCGEVKSDWWHRSNNIPLYMRRELVEEFREATSGRTIRIVSFREFLELYGASPDIIDEVGAAEQTPTSDAFEWTDISSFLTAVANAAYGWVEQDTPNAFVVADAPDRFGCVTLLAVNENHDNDADHLYWVAPTFGSGNQEDFIKPFLERAFRERATSKVSMIDVVFVAPSKFLADFLTAKLASNTDFPYWFKARLGYLDLRGNLQIVEKTRS